MAWPSKLSFVKFSTFPPWGLLVVGIAWTTHERAKPNRDSLRLRHRGHPICLESELKFEFKNSPRNQESTTQPNETTNKSTEVGFYTIEIKLVILKL